MKPSPSPFLDNEERATLKSAVHELSDGGLTFGPLLAAKIRAAVQTALLADEGGIEWGEVGPPITAPAVLKLAGVGDSYFSPSVRSDLLAAINEGLTNAYERGVVKGRDAAALEKQAAAALPLIPPAVLVSLVQALRNARGVLETVESYAPFAKGSLGALDLTEAVNVCDSALLLVGKAARGEQ